MRNGKIAMKLPEDGSVSMVNARICSEEDDVMLVTDSGRAIRFPTTDVRVFKGRDSTGVRGIKLGASDHVVSMAVIRHFDASSEERAAYLKMRRAVAGLTDDTEPTKTRRPSQTRRWHRNAMPRCRPPKT